MVISKKYNSDIASLRPRENVTDVKEDSDYSNSLNVKDIRNNITLKMKALFCFLSLRKREGNNMAEINGDKASTENLVSMSKDARLKSCVDESGRNTDQPTEYNIKTPTCNDNNLNSSVLDSSSRVPKIHKNTIEKIASTLEKKIRTETISNITHSHLFLSSGSDDQNRKDKIQKEFKKLNTLLNKVNSKDGNLTIREIALFSIYFEKIGDILPQNESTFELKELATLLGQNLKSAWVELEKEDHIDQWAEDYRPMFRPGVANYNNFNIKMNSGVGGLSLPGISHEIGVYANIGLNSTLGHAKIGSNSGALYSNKYTIYGGKISAGAKAKLIGQIGCKAGLEYSCNKTVIESKKYNGATEYAKKMGPHLNPLNRSRYLSSTRKMTFFDRFKMSKIAQFIKSILPIKTTSEMQQLDKIHQQSLNGNKRLNTLLKNHVGIGNELSAIRPEYLHVRPNHFCFTSNKIKMNASAKLNLITSVGSALTLEDNRGDLWIPIPESFTDSIKENNHQLEEIPKNYYQHAKSLIDHSTLKNKVNASLTALKLLEIDVDTYFEAVTEYDRLKSRGHLSNTEQLKQYRKIKHDIERRWGAVGRHQFIQFAAASLAYLSYYINKESFHIKPVDKEYNKEFIQSLADKIYKPIIEHSPQRLDELIYFDKEFLIQLKKKKIKLDLMLGMLTGRLSVNSKYKKHPNIFKEGQYVDIKFSLGSSIKVSDYDSITDLNDKINGEIGKLLSDQNIPYMNQFSLSPDATGAISGTYMIRLFKPTHEDYEGVREFRKLFTRKLLTVDTNFNLAIKGNAAPGVAIGASLGVETLNTEVLGDTIGTNDLVYSGMLYNSFYKRNDKNANNIEWRTFENEHKAEYQKLYQNLGNTDERVYKDAQMLLNQLIDLAGNDDVELAQANKFKKAFTQSMVNVFNHPNNEEYFQAARQNFNTLLELQIPIIREAYNDRYRPKKSKLTANSALSFGSKIKQKFIRDNQ